MNILIDNLQSHFNNIEKLIVEHSSSICDKIDFFVPEDVIIRKLDSILLKVLSDHKRISINFNELKIIEDKFIKSIEKLIADNEEVKVVSSMSINKFDKHFLVICQLYDEIKKLTGTKTSNISHKNVTDTRCSEDREFLENLLLSQRAQNEELVKNMEGLKSEFKSSHSFMKNDVLYRLNDISKQNDSLKSLVIKLNNDVLSLTN